MSEETGITSLDVRSYIGKIRYSYLRFDGMKAEKEVSFYFALTPSKNVVISYEHYEFRWVHYSDVLFMLHHEQAKNYYAKRSPERIILMTNHPSHTRRIE